jgi:hypothetical protein
MDSYGEQDMLDTKGEKLLSIHIYLLRKIFLAVTLALLFMARNISKTFGFHFEATVSDRVEWDWEVKEKIPRYHAQVERKD